MKLRVIQIADFSFSSSSYHNHPTLVVDDVQIGEIHNDFPASLRYFERHYHLKISIFIDFQPQLIFFGRNELFLSTLDFRLFLRELVDLFINFQAPLFLARKSYVRFKREVLRGRRRDFVTRQVGLHR